MKQLIIHLGPSHRMSLIIPCLLLKKLQGCLEVRKKYVPYIEIFRIYFSQILRYFLKIKIIKITHINLAASS